LFLGKLAKRPATNRIPMSAVNEYLPHVTLSPDPRHVNGFVV
jgi:hypothetical protein